jgi:hypothetical protein
MTLSSAEILSLDSAASFWEAVEYCAMGAVLLGAIGETVAEFTPVRRCKRWKRPIEILSGLLLIVGLAVEFPATMRTNSITGTPDAPALVVHEDPATPPNKENDERARAMVAAFGSAGQEKSLDRSPGTSLGPLSVIVVPAQHLSP